MIILRITAFIVLFLSAIFLPWPAVAGLAAIAMAVFSWFWESIIIGFLLGVLYSFSKGGSGFLFAFFAASFTTALLIEEYLKRLIQGRNIISYALIALSGGSLIALFWLVFKMLLFYV